MRCLFTCFRCFSGCYVAESSPGLELAEASWRQCSCLRAPLCTGSNASTAETLMAMAGVHCKRHRRHSETEHQVEPSSPAAKGRNSQAPATSPLYLIAGRITLSPQMHTSCSPIRWTPNPFRPVWQPNRGLTKLIRAAAQSNAEAVCSAFLVCAAAPATVAQYLSRWRPAPASSPVCTLPSSSTMTASTSR